MDGKNSEKFSPEEVEKFSQSSLEEKWIALGSPQSNLHVSKISSLDAYFDDFCMAYGLQRLF